MTHQKKIFIWTVFFIAIIVLDSHANAAFQDVDQDHPNREAIEFLQQNSIVDGYPDGFFRPASNINRAEFVKIIIEASQPAQAQGGFCFPDVKEEWFAPYICTAKWKGIISGYPDGVFKPTQNINFVEAAKIISLSFNFETQPNEIWFIPYVEALAQRNAMPATIDNMGRPLTRGEMSEMVYQLRDFLPRQTDKAPQQNELLEPPVLPGQTDEALQQNELLEPPDVDPEFIRAEAVNYQEPEVFSPPIIPPPSNGSLSCPHPEDQTLIPPNSCKQWTTNQSAYCNGDTGNTTSYDCQTCGCPLDGYVCQPSGACDLQNCGSEFCQESQQCINNTCQPNPFKVQSLKIGFVYVYSDKHTYNPNWRDNLKAIKPKVIHGLSEITDGKLSPSIDIIGGVRTDIFCWNPAHLGKINMPELNSSFFSPNPGSSFGMTTQVLYPGEIAEYSNCPHCQTSTNLQTGMNEVSISCESPLSYSNMYETEKLDQLQEQIEDKLGIQFSYYDEVIIVFGKLGKILESEPNYLAYKCNVSDGLIGGYANKNIILSENYIMESTFTPPNLLNCQGAPGQSPGQIIDFGTAIYGGYSQIGWHSVVHELLHKFRAVDFYNTGGMLGFDSIRESREVGLLADPRLDESVMSDGVRPECMDYVNGNWGEFDGRDLCTLEELERLYLDKLNRKKMGLDE